MAQMTFEQFNDLNNEKDSSSFSPQVSYFVLADDGDSALVRFNLKNLTEPILHSVHRIMVGGKRRNVECLRGPKQEASVCPLCASGERPVTRAFLPLLKYVMTEDNQVQTVPCVWETSLRVLSDLKPYVMDYGDLESLVFKITRHGKKGDTSTRYSITLPNQMIYKADLYPADFRAFESFSINKNMVMQKTLEELAFYVEQGSFPPTASNNPVRSENPSASMSRASTASSRESIATSPIMNHRVNRDSVSNMTPTDNAQPMPSGRRYTY